MLQEQRHIYYDDDLEIEAYQLAGIVQKFPNHFHDYYVIGFIESGARHLWCKGKEYDLKAGDLVLFNSRDNHFCAPLNGELLDYRALNIGPEVMEKKVQQITGRVYLPQFQQNVVYQSDIAQSVGRLYEAILSHSAREEKEEIFRSLLEQILWAYAVPLAQNDFLQTDGQIKRLCTFMEEHFDENITLDELLSMTDFGKSYLLRTFTKQVGISPYRYLQTVRMEKAKKFLKQGIAPVDAANLTGFNDQSHFTRFFKEFIGLTPKQYQRSFHSADRAGGQAEGRDRDEK